MMITSKFLNFIQFAAVLVLFQLNFTAQAEEPSCADYLKLNDSKSRYLSFKSCEKGKEAQLRVLTATYTLEGKYADKVEKGLNKSFNMPKLKFVCCGWQTSIGYGSFVYEGYKVSIRMFSGETILRTRADWPEISDFYVIATLYLDEP